MKMRLGQEAALALRDAETCMNIGRAFMRVDCGLAYAEHNLRKTQKEIDLADVSTGIFTAAKSADGLKRLAPPEMVGRIDSFIKTATSLNNDVRKRWVAPPKDEKTKKPGPKEPFTKYDFESLKARTEKLRTVADEVWASMRGLCVEKPVMPQSMVQPGR
jgi:hypothetical protein